MNDNPCFNLFSLINRIRFLCLCILMCFPLFIYAKFRIPYQTYRLKNGLLVILVNRKESPLASIQLYYKAGGVYEKDEYLGVSHFLEHMMFKTTKNLKPGEYSYIIKSRGGYDNAATTYEYTTYYNVLPVNEIETGIRLEAERMTSLTFVSSEFESERKVVIEERHERYQNSPIGFLWEKANEIFFKDYPYSRPVIGYEKSIKNININAMKNYYHNFYHPKNAILVIAGGFSVKKTLFFVKKYFGSIKSKGNNFQELSKPKRDFNPKGGIYFFKKPFHSTYGLILLKIPPADDPIIPSLLLLDYMLFHGRNSVIIDSLVRKKKLCYSISGGSYLRTMPSSYIIHFVPSGKVRAQRIVNEIKKELFSLSKRENFKELIRKSKLFLITDFYKDIQRVKGITETLGWSAIIKNPDYIFSLYQSISRVKTSDLRKAIMYLYTQPFSTFVLKPDKS